MLEDREVDVEVVVEEDEDEDDEEDEDDVGVLVVVELDEELAGAQVSDSEATTPETGSDICETGVPGGTLTLNV